MNTLECSIEEIIPAHPNLYLEHCAVMAVSLLSRQSASPREFLVNCEGIRSPDLAGEASLHLSLSWSDLTAYKAARIRQTEQSKAIIERAAVAMASLLFARLIPDGQMRVTRAGDRADYWLPRLKCALEVSGTTRPQEMARRHREKVEQVLSNPLGWNGYVVVCCFAAPQRIIRWSFHRQEAKADGTR